MVVHYSSLAFRLHRGSLLGISSFDGAEDYFSRLAILHLVGNIDCIVVSDGRGL